MRWEVVVFLLINTSLFLIALRLFRSNYKGLFLSYALLTFYYLFYIGASFTYLSYSYSASRFVWYLIQSAGALSLFLGFCLAGYVLYPRIVNMRSRIINDFEGVRFINTSIGIFLSFSICLLSVYQLGNIGLLGIVNIISPVDIDIVAMRKSLTAGTEGYMAPGYLKQVRDIAFPFFTVFVVYGATSNTKLVKTLKAVLIVSSVFFIISSGQRGPLFLFILFTLVSWIQIRDKTIFNKRVILSALILIAAMALLTASLGRSDGDLSIIDPFTSLFERIFMRLHDENIRSMPYWLMYDPSYGSVQLEELSKLLPGTQVGLSNYLHQYLGGSFEGNSPLQLFIALWIDFGFLGLGFIGIFLGFLITSIDVASIGIRKYLSVRLVYIYSAILLTNVQSINGFLLSGVATLLIILFLVKLNVQSLVALLFVKR